MVIKQNDPCTVQKSSFSHIGFLPLSAFWGTVQDTCFDFFLQLPEHWQQATYTKKPAPEFDFFKKTLVPLSKIWNH